MDYYIFHDSFSIGLSGGLLPRIDVVTSGWCHVVDHITICHFFDLSFPVGCCHTGTVFPLGLMSCEDGSGLIMYEFIFP